MKKVIFNNAKVCELGTSILHTSEDIYRNLNEIDNLLDLLTESFYDEKTKRICEDIKNNQIISLKDYAGCLGNMNVFLNKIEKAYNHFDNDIK